MLSADAHVRAVSGFIRDDVKAHPGRAAMYGAYVAAMMSPLPYAAVAAIPLLPSVLQDAIGALPIVGPGLSSGLSAVAELSIMIIRGAVDLATFGWIRRGSVPWTAKVSERLRLAELNETIGRDYAAFIEPAYLTIGLSRENANAPLRLRHAALTVTTLKRAWEDCRIGGNAVAGALREQAKKVFGAPVQMPAPKVLKSNPNLLSM